MSETLYTRISTERERDRETERDRDRDRETDSQTEIDRESRAQPSQSQGRNMCRWTFQFFMSTRKPFQVTEVLRRLTKSQQDVRHKHSSASFTTGDIYMYSMVHRYREKYMSCSTARRGFTAHIFTLLARNEWAI